jgi:hypothetical protein
LNLGTRKTRKKYLAPVAIIGRRSLQILVPRFNLGTRKEKREKLEK